VQVPIVSYCSMIPYIACDEFTALPIQEGILATEEEHAEDLRLLIDALGKDERSKEERR